VHGTDGPVVAEGGGEGLLFGLRPEDMRITGGPGLAARVTSVEYLGADSIVGGIAGTEPLAVRVPGRVDLAPGAAVHLAWNPDAVHLFDAQSGRRADDLRPALANA
jgi:sn-glycerol 3-phosphate transport system ATP-binding protein